eukprot:Clim_evm30s9 gene=Clim_evmTU30s9
MVDFSDSDDEITSAINADLQRLEISSKEFPNTDTEDFEKLLELDDYDESEIHSTGSPLQRDKQSPGTIDNSRISFPDASLDHGRSKSSQKAGSTSVTQRERSPVSASDRDVPPQKPSGDLSRTETLTADELNQLNRRRLDAASNILIGLREKHGLPTAMTVAANSIAFGTSRGHILVFDLNEQRLKISLEGRSKSTGNGLYNSNLDENGESGRNADADSIVAVTALQFETPKPDAARGISLPLSVNHIVAGYEDGTVLLWNLEYNKESVLADLSRPQTAMQSINPSEQAPQDFAIRQLACLPGRGAYVIMDAQGALYIAYVSSSSKFLPKNKGTRMTVSHQLLLSGRKTAALAMAGPQSFRDEHAVMNKVFRDQSTDNKVEDALRRRMAGVKQRKGLHLLALASKMNVFLTLIYPSAHIVQTLPFNSRRSLDLMSRPSLAWYDPQDKSMISAELRSRDRRREPPTARSRHQFEGQSSLLGGANDATETRLAVCWETNCRIYKVSVDWPTIAEVSARDIEASRSPALIARALEVLPLCNIQLHCRPTTCHWLDSHSLAILDDDENLKLVDYRSRRVKQTISLQHLDLVYRKDAGLSQAMRFYGSSIVAYRGQIFVIGMQEVGVYYIPSRREVLTSLIRAKSYEGAIIYASEMPTMIEMMRLANQSANGGDIAIETDQRSMKVQKRLRNAQIWRRSFLSVINSYNNQAFSDFAAFEDSTSLEVCARLTIEFCLIMNFHEELTGALYRKWCGDTGSMFEQGSSSDLKVREQTRDTFLIALQPYVLSGALGDVSPEIVNSMLDALDREGAASRLEDTLMSVPIEKIDLNESVRLCSKHFLIDALLRIFGESLGDYETPLQKIRDLIRRSEVVESSKGPALAALPERYFMALEECLLERDESKLKAKSDTWNFIIDRQGLPGVSSSYGNLSFLLRLDIARFLQTLKNAFEDPYLDDVMSFNISFGFPIPDRQLVVDILLLVGKDILESESTQGASEEDAKIAMEIVTFVYKSADLHRGSVVLSDTARQQIIDVSMGDSAPHGVGESLLSRLLDDPEFAPALAERHLPMMIAEKGWYRLGFNYYAQQKEHVEALNCLVLTGDSRFHAMALPYLERVLTEMNAHRTGSPSQQQVYAEWIRNRIDFLTSVDIPKTIDIILEFFGFEECIGLAINDFDGDPYTRFEFIGYIVKKLSRSTSKQLEKLDRSRIQLLHGMFLDLMVEVAPGRLARYIDQMLSMSEPSPLQVDISKIMELSLSSGILDAYAICKLYADGAQVALDYICDTLKTELAGADPGTLVKLIACSRKTSVITSEPFTPAPVADTENPFEAGIEVRRSVRRSLTEDSPPLAFRLISVACQVCARMSRQADTPMVDGVSQSWMDLLRSVDVAISGVKASNQKHNLSLGVLKMVMLRAIAVGQDSRALMEFSLQNFATLSSARLAESREMLSSLLDDLAQEVLMHRMLARAAGEDIMEKITRIRAKQSGGWRGRWRPCALCHRGLDPFDGSGVFFRCGHVYHPQCATGLQDPIEQERELDQHNVSCRFCEPERSATLRKGKSPSHENIAQERQNSIFSKEIEQSESLMQALEGKDTSKKDGIKILLGAERLGIRPTIDTSRIPARSHHPQGPSEPIIRADIPVSLLVEHE